MSLSISARPRTKLGRHAGALRREGLVPVVVYGHQRTAMALQTDERELQRVYQSAGRSTLVNLTIAGERSRKVLIREFQVHPRTGRVLHADFFALNLTERTTADIPVLLMGEAPAVELKQGSVVQALSMLRVEALPADLPSQLTADVSSLDHTDATVTAGEVVLPKGVTLLTDPGDVVAKISARRVRSEEDEEAESAEGEAATDEQAAEADGDDAEG